MGVGGRREGGREVFSAAKFFMHAIFCNLYQYNDKFDIKHPKCYKRSMRNIVVLSPHKLYR